MRIWDLIIISTNLAVLDKKVFNWILLFGNISVSNLRKYNENEIAAKQKSRKILDL